MCASYKSVERYTTIWYNYCNRFFNPNICHVCKQISSYNIPCNRCNMIRYCSKEHKLLHQNQHMRMCAVLQGSIYLRNECVNFTRRFNQEEWIQSRKELMHFAKITLACDIEPYERQMILFARSCLICHQQMDLKTCMTCHSSNYCNEHIEAFQNQHSSNCTDLILCLNLALNIPYNYISNNKFVTFPDEDKPVVDMNSFILQYIRIKKDINFWCAEDYYYSDYVSGPLTLYYMMKNLKLSHIFGEKESTCVVHVIAASSVDTEHICAWEILLHLLHNVHLKLVLIGTELNNKSDIIEVCLKCKHTHRNLSYVSYRMLYHTYVKSAYYIRPNVIVGFQTDFSDEKMWSASLFKSRDQDCPFLVTAESKLKSEQSISNIEKVLGTLLNLIYHDENKFRSYMPYRDFENDVVFYRNKYLAVYLNLYPLFGPSFIEAIQM